MILTSSSIYDPLKFDEKCRQKTNVYFSIELCLLQIINDMNPYHEPFMV